MYKCSMELVTTKEAAEILGVSVRRVRALIEEEKLAAKRLGRDYVIEREALSSVTVYGKAGRPPKWAVTKAALEKTKATGKV